MKIKKEFAPIQITLETEDEFAFFKECLLKAGEHDRKILRFGNYYPGNETNFEIQVKDFLRKLQ